MTHVDQPLHPETVSNPPTVVAFKVIGIQNRLSAEERIAFKKSNRVTPAMIALAADIAERFGFEADYDVEAARRYATLELELRPSIRELAVLLAQHEDTLRRAKQGPGVDFWAFYRLLKARVACGKRDDRLAHMVDELQGHLEPRSSKKEGETPTP